MIPKIIHYCWFGPKPFPRIVLSCINSWRTHLGDYEFKFWNEGNSPMSIPFVQQAYREKKYAFVSDCIRFHGLLQYGGIYLDTDMYVIKPFEPLLDDDLFFGWEDREKSIVSGGIIGSRPEHPFIRKIFDYYKLNTYDPQKKSDLILPRVLSRIYSGEANKEQITVHPFTYFYPFPYEEKENVRRFRRYIEDETMAVHLWNIGWAPLHLKLRDKALYYLKKAR